MRSLRYILAVVLAFTLVAAPTAQAQSAGPPTAAEPDPTSRLDQVAPRWSQPDTVTVRPMTADAQNEAGTAAMREPSARTALAVVGAVVLVIALVALVR